MTEKIRALEAEERSLLLEMEEPKKQTEAKAKSLKNGVSMLREVVESFKALRIERPY